MAAVPPSGERRDASLTPDEVAGRAFPTSFRGFDQVEVRAHLGRAAAALAAALQRAERAERELVALRNAPPPEPAALDDAALTAALGEETARVLQSAKDAAADIRQKSEENAQRILREAHAEADRIRGAAESVLADRTREAEASATAMVEAARATAERLVSEAESRHAQLLEDGERTKEELTAEINRRRRAAQSQLEELRQDRDRVLDALTSARRFLDEATGVVDRGAPTTVTAPAAGPADAGVGESPAGGSRPSEMAANAPETSVSEAIVPPPPPPPAPPPASVTPPATRSEPLSAVRVLRPDPPATPPAPPPPPEPPLPAAVPDIVDEGVRILGPAKAAAPPSPPPPPTPPPPVVASGPEPAAPGRRPDPPPPASDRTVDAPSGPPPPPAGPPEPAGAPEPAPAGRERPEPAAAPEPRAGASDGTHDAGPDDDPTTASGPRPDPAGAGPAVEPGPGGGDAPAPAAADERATAEPDAIPAPQPAEGAEPEQQSVEEMFERLRERRAEAVARAKVVLADGETPPSAEAAPASASAPDTGAVSTGEPSVSDTDEALLQARDGLLADVEVRLARKLKRALQDEQNELLDRLRLQGRRGAPPVLPAIDEHVARYQQTSTALLEEAVAAGAQFAGGGSPKGAAVADLAAELAAGIVKPLRRRLEQAVADPVQDDLAERIGSAYREWKTQRIERVATDHVAAAFTRGAYVATPAETELRWIVDDEGGNCPDCDDNALAGPTPKGEAFPTGQLHPPAHAGCRCLLVRANP